MDKKEKMWGQLTTCWSNLSPQLDHLKDHLKTRLAPITQQCSTWLQGGSFNNETVRIGCRDFQVLKKLGEGGYSFVYLVQELVPNADGALGCSYALKKVHFSTLLSTTSVRQHGDKLAMLVFRCRGPFYQKTQMLITIYRPCRCWQIDTLLMRPPRKWTL